MKSAISNEADRYFKFAISSNEVNYIFLKSIIYVEEMLKTINSKLHGPQDYSTLEKQIKLIRDLAYTEKIVRDSIDKLDKIKGFRNSIAHEFEYHIEEDIDFLKIMEISPDLILSDKKYKIAVYFKDVIAGFLYIKIGMEQYDDFIKFSKN